MNFEATKIFTFEMGHVLESSYTEACQIPHGHSYRLEVTVQNTELNSDGMVMDFKKLKEFAQTWVDMHDHAFLQKNVAGCMFNPTAENMARQLYLILENRLNSECSETGGVSLKRIRLWETATAYVDVTA